jgi:asparagine synthase (glutamine-hydrolysing)
MTRELAHRGPDAEGQRIAMGYGLGHRRLAIVDIAGGAQPMEDGSGKLWVTFGGEIYNHEELRAELEGLGYRFRTRADTEVLLHGWREWRTDLPRRLCGMFAFALVDEDTHELFVARDRLGKKPFYYTVMATGELLFASELKALLVDSRVRRELCPEALGHYLCLGYVPDPRSIYRDVHKLPPGCSLHVRGGEPRVQRYWQLRFEEASGQTLADTEERLLEHLDQAVQVRLMGEVPVGAFLSGGIDSQAVVASMAQAGSRQAVACSIGFDEPRFDERAAARAGAQRFGVELHEEVVRAAEMLDLDWFSGVFDEPLADDSAIPTYHVSRLARRHVTVALSGDGGDECFAGYRRYRFDVLENRWRRRLPRGLWAFCGGIYPKLDFLPRFLRLKRTLQNLACPPEEAYARSVSRVLPEQVLPLLRERWRSDDPLLPVKSAYASASGPALLRCAAADFQTWLPGGILPKVDRASMAVSLEVRAPFLDHRLVELAARIPAAHKLAGGQTKAFLRRALRGRLDAATLSRPKRGFSVPMRAWMRGSLGDALVTELSGDALADILDVRRVLQLHEQHRSGAADHGQLLWAVLVLGRFLRRWVTG